MLLSWYQSSWLGFAREKQVLLSSLECALGSVTGFLVVCTRAGEGLFEAVLTKGQKMAFLENGEISRSRSILSCFAFGLKCQVTFLMLICGKLASPWWATKESVSHLFPQTGNFLETEAPGRKEMFPRDGRARLVFLASLTLSCRIGSSYRGQVRVLCVCCERIQPRGLG